MYELFGFSTELPEQMMAFPFCVSGVSLPVMKQMLALSLKFSKQLATISFSNVFHVVNFLVDESSERSKA